MALSVSGNNSNIRQLADQMAQTRGLKDAGAVPTENRAGFLQDLTKANPSIPAAQVRDALMNVWLNVNESKGDGLQKLNAQAGYQGGKEFKSLDRGQGKMGVTGALMANIQGTVPKAVKQHPEALAPGGNISLASADGGADRVNLSMGVADGKPTITLRDTVVNYGSDRGGSDFELRVNGKAVKSEASTSSQIPFGDREGERELSLTSSAQLTKESTVEVFQKSTGTLTKFALNVPGALLDDAVRTKAYTDGVTDQAKDGTLKLNDTGKAIQSFLVTGAHTALGASSFDARNTLHAQVVGQEAAALATHNLGLGGYSDFAKVFTAAAQKAGDAFKPAFNDDGTKKTDPESEKVFKKALSAAGPVAYDALKGLSPNARSVVDRASIEDVASLVAKDLGLDMKLDGKALIDGIKKVTPKDDYFFAQIDGIKTRGPKDTPLDSAGTDTLEMGLRLANATWKSGQVHRSAWEGNDGRINPEKRVAYNPYDVLKANMFNDEMGKTKDVNLAFGRVVFEVYKDLIQLQDARKADATAT